MFINWWDVVDDVWEFRVSVVSICILFEIMQYVVCLSCLEIFVDWLLMENVFESVIVNVDFILVFVLVSIVINVCDVVGKYEDNKVMVYFECVGLNWLL